jgi:hypothetical protein
MERDTLKFIRYLEANGFYPFAIVVYGRNNSTGTDGIVTAGLKEHIDEAFLKAMAEVRGLSLVDASELAALRAAGVEVK